MKITSTVDVVRRMYEPLSFGAGRRIDVDKLGFINVGYWKGVENSIELAQINLIETLLSFLANKNGNILDVACGKGASTRYLTKYFDPDRIVGINISEAQLQICKTMAPDCDFQLMDATDMTFGDASFDNVLCIEAACHFMTRQRFLSEAHRVLKPGGRLAMSDIFVRNYDHLTLPDHWPRETWPKENCLADVDAYSQTVMTAGFRHVRVEDTTEFSVEALRRFRIRGAEEEFDETRDYKLLENAKGGGARLFGCLVYAIK